MYQRISFAAIAAILFTALPTLAELPKVLVGDRQFETDDSERVDLRGVNVGNWLLIEPWMLAVADEDLRAEYGFDQVLIERFGEEKHAELKRIWRDNYITERDFRLIAESGFNTVRVPFHYHVIEDPDALGTVEDFHYLDLAVKWATAHDLYVILDMHAAPGHQSVDGPSGRIGYNRLWTDEQAQDRFVSLWGEIAARFKNAPNVAAYDLVNEPWGEFNDAHGPVYGPLIDRAVKAVREADPATPILVAPLIGGNFEPLRRYLDAAPDNGWTGVAVTDHYYPGLFGSEPTLLSHARHVALLEPKLEQTRAWGVPLVIGEMQIVWDRLDQPTLTRWYFDKYNDMGWAPVLWSWKLVKDRPGVHPDNWYFVTNAEPWSVQLRSDSYDDIAAAFRRLGTIEYAMDVELRDALIAEEGVNIELPDPQLGIREVELTDPPAGWQTHTIGDGSGGGIVDGSINEKAFALAGRGNDIWADKDAFVYLARPAGDSEHFKTTLIEYAGSGQWSKAGIMLRESSAEDAAFVFVHAFSNGRITVAARSASGAAVVERHLDYEEPGPLPLRLAIERDGEDVRLGWARGDEPWQWTTSPADVSFTDESLIGFAVNSNMPGHHAVVTFEGGLDRGE